MTLNIILPSPVSERPYASELCCIPPAGVPYTLGAMRLRLSAYWYTSHDDYVRGRSLLSELGSGLLMPCGQDIINAVDRVSVLLDGAFNGISRVATLAPDTTNVYTYDPPLSQSADATNFHDPSLRYDTKAARWLAENFVNGTTSDFAPGEAVPNTKLERIAVAVEALGELDDDQLEQLIQIVSILGAV